MKIKIIFFALNCMLCCAVQCQTTSVQICEWFPGPPPAQSTAYTSWAVIATGAEYNTEARTCCTVWTGSAQWRTETRSRICLPAMGTAIGTSGPNTISGQEYISSLNTSPWIVGAGYAIRYVRQNRRVFNSSSASGINQTTTVNMHSSEGLFNGWIGATVTFDGNTMLYGSSINLSDVSIGNHQYVVTKTVSGITDVFTFNINVVPSYWFEFINNGLTVNPSSIIRFHNDSPDTITVDFSTSSSMIGVTTSLSSNNIQVIPPGGTTDLQLDLFTVLGYVVAPGQVPLGTIYARFGDSNGIILAQFTTTSAMVPTLSEWSLIILFLLIAASTMHFFYKSNKDIKDWNTDNNSNINVAVFENRHLLTLWIKVFIVYLFALIILFLNNQNISLTDSLGSLVSSLIIAYMLHLFLWHKQKSIFMIS